MKRLVIAGALLVSVLAVPAEAGGDYRYHASIRCNRYLTEHRAERVRLVEYDPSGPRLKVVYRCRHNTATGSYYRFGAIVKCVHYLAEDAAAHIKLIHYDTSGESLRLVYRCRGGY